MLGSMNVFFRDVKFIKYHIFPGKKKHFSYFVHIFDLINLKQFVTDRQANLLISNKPHVMPNKSY